jgi:hypothetical protein
MDFFYHIMVIRKSNGLAIQYSNASLDGEAYHLPMYLGFRFSLND